MPFRFCPRYFGMNTTFMTKADAAVALLTDKLRVSNVLDAAAITAEAKAKGIGRGTLQRAKTVLGLQARRQGFSNGGKWFWVDYSITAPAAADAAADTPNPGDSAVLIPLSILPLYKLIQQAEHMLIDNGRNPRSATYAASRQLCSTASRYG